MQVGTPIANVWGERAVAVYGAGLHAGLDRREVTYYGKLYAYAEEVADINCRHRPNSAGDATDVALRYHCADSSYPVTFL